MHVTQLLRRVPWLVISVLALGAVLVACGGDDDDDPTPTPSATPTATGDEEESSSPGATRTPAGSPVETAAGATGDPAVCEEADEERGLGHTLGFNEEDGVYTDGAPVDITLVVGNCSGSDVTLFFTTAQRYEITIEQADGGLVVWRSSDGKAFAEAEAEEVLPPAGTVVYNEIWDQEDSNGEQVDPGAYKVSGFSVGCLEEGRASCRSGPVAEIEIE